MPAILTKDNFEYYLEYHTDSSDPAGDADDLWSDLETGNHLDPSDNLHEDAWIDYVNSFSSFPKPKDVIRAIWKIIKDIVDSLE